MNIGIDLQACHLRSTGLGRYTECMVAAMKAHANGRYRFFYYEGKKGMGDWNTLDRLWWTNIELPRRLRKDQIELLHVPAFAPPAVKPCRLVVTVHDLIGLCFPNQLGWPSRFYWGTWLARTVRKADRLIADSEHTKQDLIRHLGLEAEKIRVIYPSGHEGFRKLEDSPARQGFKDRLGIRDRYFLFVGTIEPRKNLPRVLQAFSEFRSSGRGKGTQLVVVGSRQFAKGEAFHRLVRQSKLTLEDILFTGYLPQEALNELYSGADVFLFPSLYEGFGIPVLEAMASGAPVITSNVTSLPEVAGDAALLVDPGSVDAIYRAMERVAGDPALRSELVEKGFQQIQKFSWEKTARQIVEVYEETSHAR